jgi:hypothetical protein
VRAPRQAIRVGGRGFLSTVLDEKRILSHCHLVCTKYMCLRRCGYNPSDAICDMRKSLLNRSEVFLAVLVGGMTCVSGAVSRMLIRKQTYS